MVDIHEACGGAMLLYASVLSKDQMSSSKEDVAERMALTDDGRKVTNSLTRRDFSVSLCFCNTVWAWNFWKSESSAYILLSCL